MAELSREKVEAALKQIQDVYVGKDLIAANTVKDIDIEDGRVSVSVKLGYPAKGIIDAIAGEIEKKVLAVGAASVPPM